MPQDFREAARLYARAAERDDPAAELNLGCLHLHGRDMPRDAYAARLWFLRVAFDDSPFNTAWLHYLSTRPGFTTSGRTRCHSCW